MAIKDKLTRPGKALPEALRLEWADSRKPEWTPMRSEAAWKCLAGEHRYIMTRSERERLHAAGEACPRCKAAAQAAPAPKKPRAKKAATASQATTENAILDEGVAKAPAPKVMFGERGAFRLGNGAVVEYERVEGPSAPVNPKPRHHVAVIDRSGSMYADIVGVCQTVRKLAVADELASPDARVSVIGYAGAGDVGVVFDRLLVGEMIDLRMRADGLTSASGALRAVLAMVRPGEDTVVTLHSDGYFNDPSPAAEQRACLALAADLRAAGATLCTVAHRASADAAFLARLACAGGGSAAQAGNLADLHAALWRNHTAPPRGAAMLRWNIGYDDPRREREALVLAKSSAQRRVLMGIEVPVGDGDERWKFTVTKPGADRGQITMPRVVEQRGWEDAAVLFARGMIGLGRVGLAKQACRATRLFALAPHARAATPREVGDLARALDALCYDAVASESPRGGEEPRGVPVLDVLRALGEARGRVSVHAPTLAQGYERRGLKRVPGTWVGGKIQPPAAAARRRREGTGADGWLDVVGVDTNREGATATLTLSEPIELVRAPTPQEAILRSPVPERISEVAGVSLENLRQYRSFAIVGDGGLCVKSLRLRFGDKRAAAEFWGRVAPGNPIAPIPGIPFGFSLAARPIAGNGEPAAPTREQVLLVARLTVAQRVLAASLKGDAGPALTAEQAAALRAVHVTPNLYFSPPTCYPYEDLRAAQAAGKVDARVRYEVRFGQHEVGAGGFWLADLRSGNESVRRHYEVAEGQGECSAASLFDGTAQPRTKPLKRGPIDYLEVEILSFLSVASSERAKSWDLLGFPEPERIVPLSDADERRALLSRVERALNAAWLPLQHAAFAVGASGTPPDEWGPASGADAAGARGYPKRKDVAEASLYFPSDGVACAVLAKEALYSVTWEASRDA